MEIIEDKDLVAKFKQAEAKKLSEVNDPIVQERENRSMLTAQIEAQEEARIAAGILDDTNIVTRNLDVPSAIAGTAAGMKLGRPFGPMGVVASGVIGGALGTMAGAYGSAKIMNDPNVSPEEKAFHAGLTSMGFDLATMGAFKFLSPIAKMFKTNPNAVATKLTTPRAPEALTTGTDESLRQTQQYLTDIGAPGLLPTQTGKAGTGTQALTSIGSIGIFSSGVFKKHFQQNADALSKEVQKQIDGINANLAVDNETIGENVYNIINVGRQRLVDNYGNGLESLIKKYSGVKVSPVPVLKEIDSFVAQFGDSLDAPAREVIAKLQSDLVGQQMATQASKGTRNISLKIPLKDIINKEKLFSTRVDSAGNFMADVKTTSTRELSELANRVRGAIDKSLLNTSSDLASDYQGLKSAYKKSREALIPKMSNRILSNGGKENYSNIGKYLLGANPSEIKAYMKSIEEGFGQMSKAGVEPTGIVKSANTAKDMIRQSYLRTLFNDSTGQFDVYDMAVKLRKLESKEEQARLTALLGQEGFSSLKRLSNAIVESADKPSSNLFSLALRQKETSTLSQFFQAGQVGTSIVSGGAVAPFIFAVPYVAAKIGTSTKSTNRLLALNSKVEKMYQKGIEPTAEFITSNMLKVFDNFSEEDKLIIKSELEDKNKP